LNEIPGASCRLCAGPLRRSFSLRVLGRHEVAYLECQSCHSLQTEPPYWLPEAYRTNLAPLDTGAAQRVLNSHAASLIVCKTMGFRNVVDFGGGDGLLCRLLRDYGINCFVEDKYASDGYAQGFSTPNFATPDLILAFEVLEHLENPVSEIPALFDRKPAAILASTELYRGQGAEWWYLTPETGQHVFFYSAEGLKRMARQHDYRLWFIGRYILFVRSALDSSLRRRLLEILCNRVTIRFARAALSLIPNRGTERDFEALKLSA
jgi:hypothetical protein